MNNTNVSAAKNIEYNLLEKTFAIIINFTKTILYIIINLIANIYNKIKLYIYDFGEFYIQYFAPFCTLFIKSILNFLDNLIASIFVGIKNFACAIYDSIEEAIKSIYPLLAKKSICFIF